MVIREAIKLLVEFRDIGGDMAAEAIREIMSQRSTPAQTGAFLAALRMKGETPEEIAGMARVMRELCVKVELNSRRRVIDIVGTGGDSLKTFNVSTVAAFIVAGAGGAVAKHGNRSVTGHCGSADLLEGLGVKLEMGPEKVRECIDRLGIGFMFAPLYHPAMKEVAGPRRELGIRTIFNILGPLTNPAMVRAELLGVYEESLTTKLAEVLALLGLEEAMVVHVEGGIDEVSLLGKTKVAWLRDNEVRSLEITPSDLGLEPITPQSIATKTREESIEAAYRILSNTLGKHDPKRRLAQANAAVALVVAGIADDLKEGMKLADESIESGEALRKLRGLVRLSGGDESLLERLGDHG